MNDWLINLSVLMLYHTKNYETQMYCVDWNFRRHCKYVLIKQTEPGTLSNMERCYREEIYHVWHNVWW